MKTKLFFYVLILLFISCTPKLEVKINNSKEVLLSVNILPSNATKKLISSLSKFGSASNNKEENISNIKMENGLEIISFKKTSSLEINANLKINDINQLKEAILKLDTEKKHLAFSLDRKNLQSFFLNISDEEKEYLELLMAPSLQGDNITKDEYLNLIASAYGKTISNELKNSYLNIKFEAPDKIKKIVIKPKAQHTLKNKTLEIKIPLTNILVMEENIKIELNY